MVTAALANSAMGVKKSSSTKSKGNEDVIDAVRKAGITAYAASQQKRNSGGAGDASDGGSLSDSIYETDSDASWESYCRYKRKYEEKRRRRRSMSRSRSRSRHGRSRSRMRYEMSRNENRVDNTKPSPQRREEPSNSLGSYVSE